MESTDQAQQVTKLFVGNLSWNTTSESLGAAFAQFGTVVDAAVVTERESGRSKGFGFVTMSTPEEAQAAKDAYNESKPEEERMLDGRAIRVDFAQPRQDGDRR